MTEHLVTLILIRYSVQIAIVVVVAVIGGALVRLPPRWGRLAYWRVVVSVCVLLPWMSGYDASPGLFSTAAATVTSLSAPVAESTDRLVAMLFFGELAWIVYIGIVARLAWLGYGWRYLGILRRGSVPAELEWDVEALRRSLAPGATIRLQTKLKQPVTFGWRRPVVLLPPEIAGLPHDEQRTILCHELLHVARRDWLWIWLEEGMRTFFWFHPGMRLAIAQLQLGREEIIDADVVSLTESRAAYMTALMRFAIPRDRDKPALEFIRKRHLVLRMRALREGGTMSCIRVVATSAALVALITSTAWAIGLRSELAQKVYVPGNGVSLPIVVTEVRPGYTEAAMAAKIEGTVMLDCVVRPNGRPSDIVVTRSLDATYGLDREAVRALQQWRFTPGRKDGRPVAVKVHVELTFTLK
jgi:TonB family protein